MRSALAEREVWFVTGSQGLYGPETLEQVAEQSRRVADELDASSDVPVRVVWKPVLTDSDSIRRMCQDASANEHCIGLVTWMHTFSPARMWIAGLQVLDVPLLHLHTQADAALPWATLDMDFMNLNQAAHGDREFGYIQSRLGVPRTTVVGHVSDPAVTARVGSWVRAAVGRAELRSLHVARFGDTMRDVAVTEGDKVDAQARLGVTVNAHGVNALAASVDDATEAQVDALADEYEATYRVAPELRRGADRHESLREAARIEVGLRTFLEAGGQRAFTSNFEDLGSLRQLPGIAVQRLMGEGYGFAGEGDWKTATLLRTLKAMAEGLPGGTSFMEDYTYELRPGKQKILGAHMLEVCPSIASDTPSCEVHPLGIGDREDPVRLVFDSVPGPAIILGMSDMGDRFRLTLNEVDVVEPDEPLPNLPVARAVWEPKPDLRTSAECWLHAGAPHHTVMSSALTTDAVADLAEALGVELAVIDADTRPRRFRDELRWNAVYHRMAMGF